MKNIVSKSLDISRLDSEITWNYANENKISELTDKYFNSSELVGVYKLSNWTVIKVHCNNNSLDEQLKEKFELCDNMTESVAEIWFCNSKVNAEWFINPISRKSFVVGDGFWILKSSMWWIAIQITNCLPLHASAIYSSEIWWICLIWGHRMWKTTGVLNIANILWSWIIASDDWIKCTKDKADRILWSTDCSISLSNKTIMENQHIWFLKNQDIINETKKRKISYNPNKLLWEKFSGWNVSMDNVILLSDWLKNPVQKLSWINQITETAKFMVWATYHYPYYSEEIKQEHIDLWKAKLQNIPWNIYIFDRTKTSGIEEWYRILIDNIISWKR